MLEGTVKVINPLGLHMRAAAQLVRYASKCQSSITISRPGNNLSADAKSILSLLTLAASMGTVLEIHVTGVDENQSFTKISEIFSSGFGEL